MLLDCLPAQQTSQEAGPREGKKKGTTLPAQTLVLCALLCLAGTRWNPPTIDEQEESISAIAL